MNKQIHHQSRFPSSLRIISLTSLRPPAPLFTLLGLLVCTSSALSSFPLIGGPGLGGAMGSGGLSLAPSLSVEVAVVGAGISNHSSPSISISLRKNGHRLVRRPSDSCASAKEIGTWEDLTTASATSDFGRQRRFLGDGIVQEPTGDEKCLQYNQQRVLAE